MLVDHNDSTHAFPVNVNNAGKGFGVQDFVCAGDPKHSTLDCRLLLGLPCISRVIAVGCSIPDSKRFCVSLRMQDRFNSKTSEKNVNVVHYRSLSQVPPSH